MSQGQLFECSLHSIVLDSSFQLILDRLNSTCKCLDLTFRKHIIVVQHVLDSQRKLDLRIESEPNSIDLRRIRHYLPPNREFQRALVRSFIDSQASSNASTFLELTGFRKDYEIIQEGYSFYHFQTGITINLTNIKKPNLKDSTGIITTSIDNWLIEAFLICTSDKIDYSIDQLFEFKQILLPFVDLIRVDYNSIAPKQSKKEIPSLTIIGDV